MNNSASYNAEQGKVIVTDGKGQLALNATGSVANTARGQVLGPVYHTLMPNVQPLPPIIGNTGQTKRKLTTVVFSPALACYDYATEYKPYSYNTAEERWEQGPDLLEQTGYYLLRRDGQIANAEAGSALVAFMFNDDDPNPAQDPWGTASPTYTVVSGPNDVNHPFSYSYSVSYKKYLRSRRERVRYLKVPVDNPIVTVSVTTLAEAPITPISTATRIVTSKYDYGYVSPMYALSGWDRTYSEPDVYRYFNFVADRVAFCISRTSTIVTVTSAIEAFSITLYTIDKPFYDFYTSGTVTNNPESVLKPAVPATTYTFYVQLKDHDSPKSYVTAAPIGDFFHLRTYGKPNIVAISPLSSMPVIYVEPAYVNQYSDRIPGVAYGVGEDNLPDPNPETLPPNWSGNSPGAELSDSRIDIGDHAGLRRTNIAIIGGANSTHLLDIETEALDELGKPIRVLREPEDLTPEEQLATGYTNEREYDWRLQYLLNDDAGAEAQFPCISLLMQEPYVNATLDGLTTFALTLPNVEADLLDDIANIPAAPKLTTTLSVKTYNPLDCAPAIDVANSSETFSLGRFGITTPVANAKLLSCAVLLEQTGGLA